MKKNKEPVSYQEAYAELQQIVAQLQSDQADIDTLPAMLERAQSLILFCREHLRRTEDRIQQLNTPPT
jgi:exodeoxyribonuclease VII small subunit